MCDCILASFPGIRLSFSPKGIQSFLEVIFREEIGSETGVM